MNIEEKTEAFVSFLRDNSPVRCVGFKLSVESDGHTATFTEFKPSYPESTPIHLQATRKNLAGKLIDPICPKDDETS
jgi:hypothetical protein